MIASCSKRSDLMQEKFLRNRSTQMNDPIPYRINDEDIDEVLSAYSVPDEARDDARMHVRRRLLEIDEDVRMVPEDLNARREMALAEIEDILIDGGIIDATPDEPRIYP
jgi:hypothetical protein